ncbi:phage terminase large subunit [Rhizobacter sp. Root1221]|uniref:phage terminase large subunit n=1 Tax=Rhizobacter sp. Root1221 TaxID=1736433 RepID=UPI001F389E8E|nr:phage terminase large subunit [Rhizobacter sp. Root1221]
MLYLVWQHLGLPPPTPAQYDIAYFLQFGWAGYGILLDSHGNDRPGTEFDWHGPETEEPDRTGTRRLLEPNPLGREDILEAFRGIGKSYATSAFALWRLERDPYREKITVLSASGSKAKEFVSMTKVLLNTMDRFEHMRPRPDQRDTAYEFDVNGASISQSKSVRAVGITGQITGSRSTLIIPDDIEVVDNSRTVEARERLLHKTNEFSAIKVTGGADVICLGTPQTEESIYTKLIKTQGYLAWILPARYPVAAKREGYVFDREGKEPWDALCPRARKVDGNSLLAWTPTDPERFNEHELLNRESKGRSYFALQFQLDTSLSDAERYPLKLNDLIVMALNTLKAPAFVTWGHDSQGKNLRPDLPLLGFSGDHFVGPLFIDPVWTEYEQSVLFVDPSGRGKDETAWAVVKVLHGTMYCVAVDGLAGDPATAMAAIAQCAYEHKVNAVVVEPNFAGGVWVAAFEPILTAAWPPAKRGDTAGCTVLEAEWSRAQKEVRIIDTLEPVMTSHRLVVDDHVARDETLMYQLTRISRDKGCLTHDDRLDALAGAVHHLSQVLRQDQKNAAQEYQESQDDLEVERFIASYERFSAGDGRVFGIHADEEDWDDRYEVLRVTVH